MKDFQNEFVKRTQKDYTLSFKLSVIKEVDSGSISIQGAMRKYGIQGHSTITRWRKKYGTFDLSYQAQAKVMKTPQQKIYELEQKIRLLERQNSCLEQQLIESEDKAAVLDKLIEFTEQEYLIPVRKKSLPDQSKQCTKKGKSL